MSPPAAEREELDETLFFLELILALNPTTHQDITIYRKEGNELLAIMVASIKTLRNDRRGGNRSPTIIGT